MTSVRHFVTDVVGALVLTSFLFIPGDSQSRSGESAHAGRSASVAKAPYNAADDSDLAAGATWRGVAESIENRRNLDGVLAHLARVIDRETGTRQAEARLWRAAFLDRHGLTDVAAAVFDSLLAESSRYPLRLRLSVAGSAFQAALGGGRTAAAEDALGRWVELRRSAESLGATEAFLPPAEDGGAPAVRIPAELMHVALDSLEARLHLGLGVQMHKGGQAMPARFHLETALTMGLAERAAFEARFRLAVIDAWRDSTAAGQAELESLAADPRLPEVRPDLAYEVSLELADALYRTARYEEARERYARLLPHAGSADDSAWVMLQLADASAHLGAGSEARRWYDRYLSRWPAGVWSGWARFAAAEVDTSDTAALDTLRAVP